MALIRWQSNLKTASGLPEDDVVNTFFVNMTKDFGDAASVVSAWQTFMRAAQNMFGDQAATSGHTLKAYDMADPEPRVPWWEGSWSFSSARTDPSLPNEVAICLSYQAEPESGIDQKRRRGRMFFGPLGQAACVSARPKTEYREDLVDAFQTFVGALTVLPASFVVYSRVGDTTANIAEAWCDNAFDTQRRRGLAPTSRYAVEV